MTFRPAAGQGARRDCIPAQGHLHGSILRGGATVSCCATGGRRNTLCGTEVPRRRRVLAQHKCLVDKYMSDSARPNDPPSVAPMSSSSELTAALYQQLLAMARARMAEERTNHTLQPTALVNEVYLRLQKEGRFDVNNKALFFHSAAEAMRRILIEHARSKGRQKRGGGQKSVPINLIDLASDENAEQILILDDAICRLEKQSPMQAEVVRLRFYAGLSVEETASAMSVSEITVKRAWRYARAWLWRQMNAEDNPGTTTFLNDGKD